MFDTAARSKTFAWRALAALVGSALSLAAVAAGAGVTGRAAAVAAADTQVLLGTDPSDTPRGTALNATLAPAQSLSKALGARVVVTQTERMSEVLRASRTLENAVIIAPAHVTASALLHAYTLLATRGDEQVYALVARAGITSIDQLKGTRLYLPQQDSLRSYVAKGLLQESGVKLSEFKQVTYGNTSAAGLVALSFGIADATIADAAQARDWLLAHPGEATVLKSTRPVPGGVSLVVRKDLCATACAKLTQWLASPAGVIAGVGGFKLAGPDSAASFTYVASLGIATPAALAGVKLVSADEVAALLGQLLSQPVAPSPGRQVVVVDTRSAKEFASEHIKGAVSLPYLERSLKEVDFDASKDDFTALAQRAKTDLLVFLCNGPECWKSYKASKFALAAGYANVAWFRGGMPEWRARQMPVEASPAILTPNATPIATPAAARGAAVPVPVPVLATQLQTLAQRSAR